MKRSNRLKGLCIAALAVVAAASAFTTQALAGPDEPTVPSTIKVDDGHKVFLVGHAVGVQIYSCSVTATGYAWSFVAPRADLYDDNGKVIVTHSAGPRWEANDGSYVVGSVVARATVDSSAIAWLKLARASSGAGSDGDRLAATTYIQRIATTGGLAPAPADCNSATVGETAEIPYTADYYFWKRVG